MALLSGTRIRHSVAFKLKHDEGSDAEADFIRAITALQSVPGVEAFELMREVSPKNDFDYFLTMEFADQSAYAAYNDHPEHAAFVQQRWDAEVTDFLEIDSIPR